MQPRSCASCARSRSSSPAARSKQRPSTSPPWRHASNWSTNRSSKRIAGSTKLVFQEIFQTAPPDSQIVQRAALLLLVLGVGLLIAPSMHHQVLYRGEDRQGALRSATRCASASLLPVTLALGGSAYVAFEQLFGRPPASRPELFS